MARFNAAAKAALFLAAAAAAFDAATAKSVRSAPEPATLQCANQPWDKPHDSVEDLPDTASMVPVRITYKGEPIGWQGFKFNGKMDPKPGFCSDVAEEENWIAKGCCDQLVAMSVDDDIVRGVSSQSSQSFVSVGFSLGFFGDGENGDQLKFQYWSGAEQKIYYSEYQHTFKAGVQTGSFTAPFVLALQETDPYDKPKLTTKPDADADADADTDADTDADICARWTKKNKCTNDSRCNWQPPASCDGKKSESDPHCAQFTERTACKNDERKKCKWQRKQSNSCIAATEADRTPQNP